MHPFPWASTSKSLFGVLVMQLQLISIKLITFLSTATLSFFLSLFFPRSKPFIIESPELLTWKNLFKILHCLKRWYSNRDEKNDEAFSFHWIKTSLYNILSSLKFPLAITFKYGTSFKTIYYTTIIVNFYYNYYYIIIIHWKRFN